jgi:hypothetical protein
VVGPVVGAVAAMVVETVVGAVTGAVVADLVETWVGSAGWRSTGRAL